MLWKLFVDIRIKSENQSALSDFFINTLGASNPLNLTFDSRYGNYFVNQNGDCNSGYYNSSLFSLEEASNYLKSLQVNDKVKDFFKGYYIELLDRDHGQKVKKFFQFIGCSVEGYGFNNTLEENDRARYYGLQHENNFDSKTLSYIQQNGGKIILLEEAYDLLANHFSFKPYIIVDLSSVNKPNQTSGFQIGDTVEFPVRKTSNDTFCLKDHEYTNLPSKFHDNGVCETFSNRGKVLDFCELEGKKLVVVQFIDILKKPSNAGWYPSQLKLVSSQLKHNKDDFEIVAKPVSFPKLVQDIRTREIRGKAVSGRSSFASITCKQIRNEQISL